ncbi:MAG: hypothetical protein QHI38_13025 [Armatimonadota bacterium]|nr:hypothetical protein [Armatimonadota bacterium]
MRKVLLTAALVFAFASPGVLAWNAYLDGSTMPSDPWWPWPEDPAPGELVLVDGETCIRMSAPADEAAEYYLNPTQEITLGAARFRLESYSPSGAKDLLCVIANNLVEVTPDGDMIFSSPSVSITLVDGCFWVYDYTEGTGFVNLGLADNAFHTAYILVDGPQGTATVAWDGNIVYQGNPPSHDFDGWIEWGAGSWQVSAAVTADFDWVGYGGPEDMVPEPSNLATIAVGLSGLVAAIRRRR